jgi:hypothetical protein
VADPNDITLESIAKVMRELEVEQDAKDLDMFLSDNWHPYRILRGGGVLMQFDGNWYAVERSLLSPNWLEWPKNG